MKERKNERKEEQKKEAEKDEEKTFFKNCNTPSNKKNRFF